MNADHVHKCQSGFRGVALSRIILTAWFPTVCSAKTVSAVTTAACAPPRRTIQQPASFCRRGQLVSCFSDIDSQAFPLRLPTGKPSISCLDAPKFGLYSYRIQSPQDRLARTKRDHAVVTHGQRVRRVPRGSLQSELLGIARQAIEVGSVKTGEGLQKIQGCRLFEDLGIQFDRRVCAVDSSTSAERCAWLVRRLEARPTTSNARSSSIQISISRFHGKSPIMGSGPNQPSLANPSRRPDSRSPSRALARAASSCVPARRMSRHRRREAIVFGDESAGML